jgi:phosphate transport system permease protein
MNNKFLARAKRNDRIAAWLINIGGLFVIISVIGILVLITKVAIPLFLKPEAAAIATVNVAVGSPNSKVVAIGADEYMQTGFILDETGTFSFFNLATGAQLAESTLVPPGGGKRRLPRLPLPRGSALTSSGRTAPFQQSRSSLPQPMTARKTSRFPTKS